MANEKRWRTRDELEHIQHTGEHREVKHDPLPLLRGYLKAALKRDNWEDAEKGEEIDREAVIAYAESMIAYYEEVGGLGSR